MGCSLTAAQLYVFVSLQIFSVLSVKYWFAGAGYRGNTITACVVGTCKSHVSHKIVHLYRCAPVQVPPVSYKIVQDCDIHAGCAASVHFVDISQLTDGLLWYNYLLVAGHMQHVPHQGVLHLLMYAGVLSYCSGKTITSKQYHICVTKKKGKWVADEEKFRGLGGYIV